MEAARIFLVGLADLAVTRGQDMVLCSGPLGACLGIAIYDPKAGVSGLLHSMLPDSSIGQARAEARPGMFLDTGINALLKRAYGLGAHRENLLVYVAGGGRIMDESSFFNLGSRNYEVLTALLAKNGLSIHAEDVGGSANRSMQLDTVTGEVRVSSSGVTGEKNLCKR
jgi:chemotaxis protein CheD